MRNSFCWLIVLLSISILVFYYSINDRNYYPNGCIGYNYGETICDSEKYSLEEYYDSMGNSLGFYLYEKSPNERFVEGFELRLIAESDNYTDFKDRIIGESNVYSVYGGR